MPGKNLTRAEAEARASIVRTDSYEVALDLTTAEDTFRSTSTVRFDATAGESKFIDLIAPRVHRITLNGTDLDPAGSNGTGTFQECYSEGRSMLSEVIPREAMSA